VTTEQELKLAAVAVVVVVGTAVVDAVEVLDVVEWVVATVLDDVDGEELHAAKRMAEEPAAMNSTAYERTFERNLIGFLGRGGHDCRQTLLHRVHLRSGEPGTVLSRLLTPASGSNRSIRTVESQTEIDARVRKIRRLGIVVASARKSDSAWQVTVLAERSRLEKSAVLR
jgi:hypothetical protein